MKYRLKKDKSIFSIYRDSREDAEKFAVSIGATVIEDGRPAESAKKKPAAKSKEE